MKTVTNLIFVFRKDLFSFIYAEEGERQDGERKERQREREKDRRATKKRNKESKQARDSEIGEIQRFNPNSVEREIYRE